MSTAACVVHRKPALHTPSKKLDALKVVEKVDRQWRTCCLLLTYLVLFGSAWALEVPPLTGRVVDRAGILSSELASSLTNELAAHEQRTGNQVVLLAVPSLEGDSPEEFAHRVATSWKLGRKGVDNGVLVLVAVQDRKIRIEVGYGLEGTLTDAKASRIIRQEMVPKFRSGDYPGGIVAGLRAVLGTIEGTYTAKEDGAGGAGKEIGQPWEIVILAVFLGIVVGSILGGKWKGPGGFIGSLIAFFTSLSAGWLLALGAAIIVLIVLLFLATVPRNGGRGGSGPWMSPGWSSGGGWSGSGGFSGGGGDFGGGGASGQW